MVMRLGVKISLNNVNFRNLNGFKSRVYFLFFLQNIICFSNLFFFHDRLCDIHTVKKNLETQQL